MTKDEKIAELESRIEKLEKIERNRKIRNIILLCIYGVIVIGLVVVLFVFYQKIKPYKEDLDNLKNFGNNLKQDTIVGGDNGFGDFSDFFNDFFNY